MSRVSFPICVSTVLVVLLGMSMATAPASAQEKPNIVVIWGDDIGMWNVGAYTHGMMGRTPNIDSIAREGEVGEEIFFIGQGRAEIRTEGGAVSRGALASGDYFGDLSLILGEKRTASVKALTYCEVFVLSKKEFNRIKAIYPEMGDVLKRMSSEKTDKTAALVLAGITL